VYSECAKSLMDSTRRILLVFAGASLASGALGSVAMAQNFPARAPAAADWAALGRLPDFTGVWETGPRGAAPQGRGARAVTEGRGSGPALTPEYAARRAAALAHPAEDGPAANCLPPGMPGIMGQPYPMEFLLTPGQVTILIEAYNQIRHIYTDGRQLPDDPDPTFHGTSVGRWEGDTLVAETVGFSPLTQIASGVPHGDKMRIVERFRLSDPDTMTIETTISDPEALTSPYTTSRTLRRHRDWTLAEYICEQNNRNFVDENGKAGIKLGAPGGVAPRK
jgi:hypothetical protein